MPKMTVIEGTDFMLKAPNDHKKLTISPILNFGFGRVRQGGECDPTRVGGHMAFLSAVLPRINRQPCALQQQWFPPKEP
jgi:hypothetical protein